MLFLHYIIITIIISLNIIVSIEHCDTNSEQPPKEPAAGEYEVANYS